MDFDLGLWSEVPFYAAACPSFSVLYEEWTYRPTRKAIMFVHTVCSAVRRRAPPQYNAMHTATHSRWRRSVPQRNAAHPVWTNIRLMSHVRTWRFQCGWQLFWILKFHMVVYSKVVQLRWKSLLPEEMNLFTWNLAKLSRVRSMYATKYQRYGLLNFYDIQNADSITTLRIGQNSELVWQVTSRWLFWQISSNVM